MIFISRTLNLVLNYTNKLFIIRWMLIVLLLNLQPILFLLRKTALFDDNQADIIDAFNSTSRYLNDLLNIDNPSFEGMVNQFHPPELQLN